MYGKEEIKVYVVVTHFNGSCLRWLLFILKGHGNEADLLGFCINRFGIGPVHYISSRSDFDFESAEIFVIEKRLPDSPSRGVDKNAYRYMCFQTFESISGVSKLHPGLFLAKLAL